MMCEAWRVQRGVGRRRVCWVAWPCCATCQGCPETQKVFPPALIPVPGWGQPQPWPVRAGPTDDSHPPWGTEQCPVLGVPCLPHPLCCQACAGRVCPLLLPCPGLSHQAQLLLLTRGCPPALLRALNCTEGSFPAGALPWLPGLPHPAMGPVPVGGGGGGDRASACPFTPTSWGITVLAPYVTLPAQPCAAPAT